MTFTSLLDLYKGRCSRQFVSKKCSNFLSCFCCINLQYFYSDRNEQNFEFSDRKTRITPSFLFRQNCLKLLRHFLKIFLTNIYLIYEFCYEANSIDLLKYFLSKILISCIAHFADLKKRKLIFLDNFEISEPFTPGSISI